METKRLIITVAALLLIVLTWERVFQFVGERLGYDMTTKVVPADASTQPTSASSEQAAATPATMPFIPASSIGASSTGPTTNGSTTAPAGWAVVSADTNAKSAELGSVLPKNSTYLLGAELSPEGAGFDAVTLNDYTKTVETPDPYVFEEPYPDHESRSRPLATRSITLDGKQLDLDVASWRLEASDANSARYSLDLWEDGKPAIHLVKTFQVFPRSDAANGSGYEVLITQNIENETNRPINVGTSLIGPTSPPRELERGGDRQVISGYLPSKDEVQLAHHTVEEFTNDKPTRDLTTGDASAPLAWVGACSAYFDAIVRPQVAGAFSKVTAEALNSDPAIPERMVTTTFDTAQLIPAGGSTSLPLRVFFGPKLRSLLKSSYYSNPPLHYDSTLVMTGGPCSFCTSDNLISALVLLLGFFHAIFRDWGLAIIVLVILVRACLHPIMKRSQANMMKMGSMGPEIERLKKKYGDDKDAMSKAQMELMKEQGFAPILGCLPMFLQMPIFIALWSCLQSTFELRHSPFLAPYGHHLTWIKDLAQPDKLVYFPNHPISFFFIHFDAINLLPLLVAVVSFINQKVTPKPPAATPEAEQQQKMMQWMTLVFPLMFYNLPSGLNLYYVTSTSIGILEGKIIRRHIKEKADAATAGRVIVDAKPTRASKQSKRDEIEPGPKRTGLMGWVAKMQDKAEQIRKDSERGGKPKP